MTPISKVKKSVLYVISFLIITMFSLLAVVISNLATTDLITKDNNVSMAEESVCAMKDTIETIINDDGSYTVYIKKYDMYDTFTISDKGEWDIFRILSACTYKKNGSTIPCDFYGKTVKLIADIDFTDPNERDGYGITYPIGQPIKTSQITFFGSFNPFRGTFDGQGHTLSKFSIGVGCGDIDENIGLFGVLNSGAEIKNLRLCDIQYYNTDIYNYSTTSGNTTTIYRVYSNMGAIAGRIQGEVIIDSCSIETLKFWNNRLTIRDGDFTIGGVVGFAGPFRGLKEEYRQNDGSEATIKNCNVSDMTVGAKNQGTRNWILGYEDAQNITVKDCVYSGVSWVSTYGDDVNRSNLVEYFTDVTPQNTDGYLKFADISKYGNTAWQKNATNSRPYLTVFTNPTTYTVKATDGQGTLLVYTVDDKSTVEVEKGKEYTLKIPTGTTLPTTSNYQSLLSLPTLKTTTGDSIVFVSANSSGGYKFIKWSASDKIYTAQFETTQTTYTLTFNNATKSSQCTNSGTPTISQPTSGPYALLEGAQIKLYISNKLLKFLFKDSNNNDMIVQYSISSSVKNNYGWYFSYCGNDIFDNDNLHEQIIYIDSNMTISPEYNYKIFNVVFWKDGFDNYEDIELTFTGAENENYSGTNNSGKTANGALFKLEYGGSISAIFPSKDVKFISNIGNYSENKEVSGQIINNMCSFAGFNVQDKNKNKLEKDNGYYYIKSDVEIYPIVEERTNVSFIDVELYIPNGITLTDDGTEISGETYTVKMIANSELRYYINAKDQKQRIILFDKSLNSIYDILEFTISGENVSPQNKFKIDDIEYSTTGNVETIYDDVLAGESIKVIPIYKYSVNISKNLDDDSVAFQNVSSGVTTSKTDNNTSLNIGIENQTDINITITKQSDNNYIYKFSYELDNNEISFECITKQLKYIVNNININNTETSLENGSTITFTSKSDYITILAELKKYDAVFN
ncbi:MAG: hypothetical protein ACI4L6_00185 [Candidatus Onthoplasma sp.]